MGAVFALFAGWYFWTPKLFGLRYNELYGQIHFWALFIGVNLTFFPMHFLGLQGMPRRIPDYPDAYQQWNLVCSFGSLLSVIATFFFAYIIYDSLVTGKISNKNPWLIPLYFMSYSQFIYNGHHSYSLEWELNSPPSLHSYNTLPQITTENSK